ncbi:MAG: GNAT family N-acetyltransferase [Chloroflexales bacterium]|nr:GNAT family N-acetyltransferase [Chloroflexales bacterium]
MSTRQRQLDLPNDLPKALNLADVSVLSIPHVADWPYRFSSWALDNPLNTRAWLDGSSQLLGWAVMQTPFWAIDCVIHPNAPSQLYTEMIEWTQARAKNMAALGEGRPMWFVSIATACRTQRRDLTTLGFKDVSEAGEDAWSKVLFELVDDSLSAPIQLPEGLQIRSLNTSSEIQAYVTIHREVFQSENMTLGWRTNATCMPDYRNELDLVITSEPGELYGFCVAWLRQLASGETVGQIDPLGVRESHRGQKLSQALLAEAVRRLRRQGASRIYVETDKQRSAAMTAYTSMGFRIAHNVLVYRYDVTEQ